MQGVVASVIVRIPVLNRFFLSSEQVVLSIHRHADARVDIFSGTFGRRGFLVFEAFAEYEVRGIHDDVWISHQDYLCMIVRKVGFEILQQRLGFFLELSSLREGQGCVYAFSAVVWIVQKHHETVPGDFPEVSLVVS